MKAENQRKRRAAAKRGVSVRGMDYDHNRGRFVSEKTNRSATKTSNNTLRKPKKNQTSRNVKQYMRDAARKRHASAKRKR